MLISMAQNGRVFYLNIKRSRETLVGVRNTPRFQLGENASLPMFDMMRDATRDKNVIFMFGAIFRSIFICNTFYFELRIKRY
jgi:hypothetical protein